MALKEYEVDMDSFADDDRANSEINSIDLDPGLDISGPLYKFTEWQFIVLISGM